MRTELLHHNEWVSLYMKVDPANGINGYVYSHETCCNGRNVAILPYRSADPGGLGAREYLIRSEVTPCWGPEKNLSAISGKAEIGGGLYAEDAVRELEEEAGYKVPSGALIPLGQGYASKSSDTIYALWGVDLTEYTPGRALGDGSRLEREGSTVWLPASKLAQVPDPQVSTMYVRLAAVIAGSVLQ